MCIQDSTEDNKSGSESAKLGSPAAKPHGRILDPEETSEGYSEETSGGYSEETSGGDSEETSEGEETSGGDS